MKINYLPRIQIKKMLLLCAGLIFLIQFSLFSVHGRRNDRDRRSNERDQRYEYQIAACLMFYNESFFLKEWIEYHKLIGVEHFYLFNNGSTDNYLEILEPYLSAGEVELFDYPQRGNNQAEHNIIQCCMIYNDAFAMTKGKVKWLAIIDADEFIYPVTGSSLLRILNKYDDEKIGGVYVDYLFFGTSHIKKIPKDRLITESLNHCAASPMAFGKSIVRPERVSGSTDPHRMWYHPPFVHCDTKKRVFDWTPPDPADDLLLLYHYYLGDEDHALNVTFDRRRRWIGIERGSYLQGHEHLNARFNDSMMRFVVALRQKMNM